MDEHTILVSIVTSLIASVVFWIVFSLIPTTIKYFQIRPRVETDITDIKLHLLFFIQIPFLQSIHATSVFQADIEDKKLKEEDFANALFGKCLSEAQCKNEFEHRLLPVGESLENSAIELDKRLDRIQRYSEFLKIKEVLVLKEIGEKIHAYDYAEHKTIIDGIEIVAVNPTISYMTANFYMLFSLYHELKEMCDAFCLVKRNDYEKYRVVWQQLEKKHYIRYYIKRLTLDKKHKDLITIRYYFLKEKKKKVKERLQDYLEHENQKLVSIRGYLDYLLSDDEYLSLCVSVKGEDEVQELVSFLNAETRIKQRFVLRNEETKKIIDEKEKRNPKITELGEAEIRIINKLFDAY